MSTNKKEKKEKDNDLVELHIESTNPSDSNREIPIDTSEKLSLLIESVARNACLPRIHNVEREPLDAKNIEPFAKTVEKSLTILDVILDRFTRKQIKAIKHLDPLEKCAVMNLLLLCGEHQHIFVEWKCDQPYEDKWVKEVNQLVNKSSPWITEETYRLSLEILMKLETMTRRTVRELITLYGELCLKKLSKQGATATLWSQHVATTHCYLWILVNIDATHLFSHIKELKSMDLICALLTHHSSEYKLEALRACLCLMSKLSDEDISLLFESEKLIRKLKSTLYHSDTSLILPATHCIIKYMTARRNLRPNRNDAMLVEYEWGLIDELREILIPFIETTEQTAYIDAFSVMIGFTRICTLRWHYPIMQIIEKAIPRVNIYSSILHLFETYLLNTWPYIRNFSEQYCTFLFKILMESETEEQQEGVYKCFYLIKHQCDKQDDRLQTFLSNVRAQVKNKKIAKLIDHEFDEKQYEAKYFSFDQQEDETKNL
uniref:Uncharacterized protein n=1 Tax=Cacopsylla melanoneura TaxID=428564 RepID=A0A8D9EEL6_9HEMI